MTGEGGGKANGDRGGQTCGDRTPAPGGEPQCHMCACDMLLNCTPENYWVLLVNVAPIIFHFKKSVSVLETGRAGANGLRAACIARCWQDRVESGVCGPDVRRDGIVTDELQDRHVESEKLDQAPCDSHSPRPARLQRRAHPRGLTRTDTPLPSSSTLAADESRSVSPSPPARPSARSWPRGPRPWGPVCTPGVGTGGGQAARTKHRGRRRAASRRLQRRPQPDTRRPTAGPPPAHVQWLLRHEGQTRRLGTGPGTFLSEL